MSSGPSDPLGVVQISAKEIYEAVVMLRRDVGRLLDLHNDLSGDIKDHESRLRSLESARWPLPSLALVVSLGALLMQFLQSRG